ncbi:MAG: hypothetical protein ACRD0K_09410 [Egibacteraceae bacterium]
MSEEGGVHPDSQRIERVRGAVVAFTPCHGARVFLPSDQAVPGAALQAMCPRDGVDWELRLTVDRTAVGGLRPHWRRL